MNEIWQILKHLAAGTKSWAQTSFFWRLPRYMHSRMRDRSSGLVTTADETSCFGVLFSAEFDGIVRKPRPCQSYAVKFLKYFWTLFFLILVQRHGVIIFISTNERKLGKAREIYLFFCLFWRRVLRTRIFFCLFWRRVFRFTPSKHRMKQAGKIFCSCWLVKLEAVNKKFCRKFVSSGSSSYSVCNI